MNGDEELIKQCGNVAGEVIKQGYGDVKDPLVKPLATSLGLVPRAINAALAGVQKWILHREYSVEKTKKLLEIKLASIEPENIVSPSPHVAVPALQYISYCMDNEELRDMYANLLANAMNKVVRNGVHPSFVEIIKQLCPDEARILRYIAQQEGFPLLGIRYENPSTSDGFDIMKHFSDIGYKTNCEYPQDFPKYLDNLVRLGLVELEMIRSLTFKEFYQPLKEHTDFKKLLVVPENYTKVGYVYPREIPHFGVITRFGKDFCRICITDGIPNKELQKNA